MNTSPCPRCNGEMAPGALKQTGETTGNAKFRPDNAPFSLFVSSYVEVSATMCLDCGFIELRGDVTRLRQVLRREN